MKTTIVLSVLLILKSITFSQDWSKLPELPVWYEEINGRGINMSYLPNFDTANGGKDAIYFGYGNFTNYNRFKGDTTNMFSFDQGHSRIWRGDFNGDGITDYSTSYFMFYKGVKKFAPPLLPKVRTYDIKKCIGNIGTVTDINNDGKDDMIYFASTRPDTSKTLGALLLGNENIQDMEIVYLPFTEWLDFDESAQCLMDAYYVDGKGARIITMTWDKNYANGKLHLWAVDITGDKGKRTVKYSWLSSIKFTNGDAQIYLDIYTPYHNKKLPLDCFKLHPNTFNLANDKIELVNISIQFGSGGVGNITPTIKNSAYYNWIQDSIISGRWDNYLFEGNPLLPTTPFCKYPLSIQKDNSTLYQASIIPTGDVNKDGVNDLACTYTSSKQRIFRVYLGVDGNTRIEENDKTGITMQIQNPLRKDLPFTLQITSSFDSQATIELFSLRGDKMFEIWNGILQIGSQSIYFDGNKYNVPVGMYNVRLKTGKTIVDKAIIIE